MSATRRYSYRASVKSSVSDELINTYFIRPIAGTIVRALFPTRITPNQVTIVSIFAGFVAAYFYAHATMSVAAGICITLKDILDSADGQLARAKEHYSRMGRFLDSIGDFIVNLSVFTALSFVLYAESQSLLTIVLGVLGFWGTTLRVSYHVFYQTSFLHLQDSYHVNRTSEEMRAEDRRADSTTLQLQRIFQFLYGWQDRFMICFDTWCRKGLQRTEAHEYAWFGDRVGLRISGLMGLGTELFVLTMFSLVNKPESYLYFNLIVLNSVWLLSATYRKGLLARRLKHASFPVR